MKHLTFICSLLILAASCVDNRKPTATATSSTDSLPVIQTEGKSGNDTIQDTAKTKLGQDTTNEKIKPGVIPSRSQSLIRFEDFPVDQTDHRKHAPLDLKSNKTAGNFRTRLREAFDADTSNFAGHYTFVYWGCGTSCQFSMLIDRKTGKVYEGPVASLGYSFQVKSSLLIVNPPDPYENYDDCSYCDPVYYNFDGKTKTFVKLQTTK